MRFLRAFRAAVAAAAAVAVLGVPAVASADPLLSPKACLRPEERVLLETWAMRLALGEAARICGKDKFELFVLFANMNQAPLDKAALGTLAYFKRVAGGGGTAAFRAWETRYQNLAQLRAIRPATTDGWYCHNIAEGLKTAIAVGPSGFETFRAGTTLGQDHARPVCGEEQFALMAAIVMKAKPEVPEAAAKRAAEWLAANPAPATAVAAAAPAAPAEPAKAQAGTKPAAAAPAAAPATPAAAAPAAAPAAPAANFSNDPRARDSNRTRDRESR